jgi:hypothetical protein
MFPPLLCEANPHQPLQLQGSSAIVLVDVGTDAKDMHIIPYLGFVSVEYLHIRDADTLPEMISSAMAAASSLISHSRKNAYTSSLNHLPESSNLHELTLMHSSSMRKVRRGNSEPDETGFDGGYVVMVSSDEHERSYDLILSAGVADDVSFEEEMASLYNAPVHLYDGTIDEYPSSRRPTNVFFHNENVTSNYLEGSTLSEYFQSYKDIFLKMDIEGHEFGWFESLSAAELLKMKQIVVEIHMSEYPVELMQKQRRVLSRLANTHVLLHAHGNNCRNVPWLADHLCPRGAFVLSRIPIFPHDDLLLGGIPNGPTYCISVGEVQVQDQSNLALAFLIFLLPIYRFRL